MGVAQLSFSLLLDTQKDGSKRLEKQKGGGNQSIRLEVILSYYGVGLTVNEWLQRGSKLFSISMARIYICGGVHTYFGLLSCT